MASFLAFPLGGSPGTKTLTELIAIIRFRGDFRNVQRFPDVNLTTEIQASFAELYELIADTNEGYWDTSIDIITAVSTAFVTLPDDAWRVRGIDLLDSSGNVDYALNQCGIADRNRYSNLTSRPEAFRLSARGAELYPTPNAEYTLRLTYTPTAPILGDAAVNYYNGWEEYVVYATLVRLALNEERSAGEWERQLDFQRQRIIRGASQRKASEPEYLPLRGSWSIDNDEVWR